MRHRYAVLLPALAAACSREVRRSTDTEASTSVNVPASPQSNAPVATVTAVHAGATIPGTTYRLAYVATASGDFVLLDTVGTVGGAALASLKVPPLARDERLFMASCDVNGKLDPYVVAIVVNQPATSKFTQIRQAWRANSAQSRFDVLPVTGVSCEDPGG